MNFGRCHAMNAGRISTPAIMFVPIRKTSNTLISLWNSNGENAHGKIPPTMTANVLNTAAPVVCSAVVIALGLRPRWPSAFPQPFTPLPLFQEAADEIARLRDIQEFATFTLISFAMEEQILHTSIRIYEE